MKGSTLVPSKLLRSLSISSLDQGCYQAVKPPPSIPRTRELYWGEYQTMMSTSRRRPYRHIGVALPVESCYEAPENVLLEWPPMEKRDPDREDDVEDAEDHVADEGFLLVTIVKANKVHIVQSNKNGQLYVQKILKGGSRVRYATRWPHEMIGAIDSTKSL